VVEVERVAVGATATTATFSFCSDQASLPSHVYDVQEVAADGVHFSRDRLLAEHFVESEAMGAHVPREIHLRRRLGEEVHRPVVAAEPRHDSDVVVLNQRNNPRVRTEEAVALFEYNDVAVTGEGYYRGVPGCGMLRGIRTHTVWCR
jgi:hypothetical protein